VRIAPTRMRLRLHIQRVGAADAFSREWTRKSANRNSWIALFGFIREIRGKVPVIGFSIYSLTQFNAVLALARYVF